MLPSSTNRIPNRPEVLTQEICSPWNTTPTLHLMAPANGICQEPRCGLAPCCTPANPQLETHPCRHACTPTDSKTSRDLQLPGEPGSLISGSPRSRPMHRCCTLAHHERYVKWNCSAPVVGKKENGLIGRLHAGGSPQADTERRADDPGYFTLPDPPRL